MKQNTLNLIMVDWLEEWWEDTWKGGNSEPVGAY